MKGNVTLSILNNGKWFKMNILNAVLTEQDNELEGPIPYGVNRAEVEMDLVDQNGELQYHKLVVMGEGTLGHHTGTPHPSHVQTSNLFSQNQTAYFCSKKND